MENLVFLFGGQSYDSRFNFGSLQQEEFTMTSYKETLHLPKTDFPLHNQGQVCKPNSYVISDPYAFMRERDGEKFILHDGPPYANGDIHVGHALNKILKDFVLKAHYFAGYKPEFRPGWDMHGLPIERKVVEAMLANGSEDNEEEDFDVRHACRHYAGHQLIRQRQQFMHLGVVADWSNPYLTMDFKYEAMLYRNLCKLAKEGLVYRQLKPVYWSAAEETSLAEAEIIYKEKTDTSVYVAFDLPGSHLSFLVWTTTPWTLPANVAVCLNPDVRYFAIEHGDRKYIVAEKRLHDVFISCPCFAGAVVHLVSLEDIQGFSVAATPLDPQRFSKVIFDKFVDMETGTGCVHIAPGHGEIDYQISKKYSLPIISPVDEQGRFTLEVVKLLPDAYRRDIVGRSVLTDGNDKILEILESQGKLVAKKEIRHEYPYCQRSNTPVIFRSTPNWFLNLREIKEKAIASLDKIDFYPLEARQKLGSMLANRDEWCISRQRKWGVPIAFFERGIDYKTGIGETILENEILEHTAMMFEKYGCDCWWTAPNDFFLPPNYHNQPIRLDSHQCPIPPSNETRLFKCMDTLDVWFDSGLSWTELNGEVADLYLEGSDQFRGWFQSSLLLSIALEERSPFKKVVSHGFVVDNKGHKMAKSEGNVVSPLDAVEKYGADVLRMWVATTDFTNDVRLSDEQLERAKDAYQKARNVLRYCLANMPKDRKPVSQIYDLDTWISFKTKVVCGGVFQDILTNRHHEGMQKLLSHLISDVSSVYFNAVKDRLYCESTTKRESAQTALYTIFDCLVRCLAPILTYTVEEAIQHAPAWYREETPHVFAIQPKPFWEVAESFDGFREGYWKEALKLFTASFDLIKKTDGAKDLLDVVIVREAGQDAGFEFPEEVGLTIQTEFARKQLDPGPVKTFLKAEDFFGVSDLGTREGLAYAIGDSEPLATFEMPTGGDNGDRDHFFVYRSQAQKCPRCWKRTSTETDKLCTRCDGVLRYESQTRT